ncbi:helix-turn-helix transcriptional regulator [Actinomadura sediminis]|uniref:AAA family ATPase n=1 Tax=Actinomadura sediminis TaxID=1038904 RepID=A0ABW3EXQ4_9ACTN
MGTFERDVILDELKTIYEESSRGQGRVVLVSGGVAVGKTELLYRFAEHVMRSGALLLSAVGSAAEHGVRMGVIGQLFYSAELPAEHAADVDCWVDAAATGANGGSPVRLMQKACSVLLGLARSRPLVIAVDDVHLADAESLQTLLSLHRRIGAARVLIVLNQRVPVDRDKRELQVELARRPYFRGIELRPLTAGEVAGWLAARLPAPPDDELAEAVYRLSGGNPLLVTALVEDHRAESARSRGRRSAPAVAGAFAHAMQTCLQRCDETALRTARAAAVLGASAERNRIARVLDLEAAAVTAALERLERDGLMEGHGFRHPRALAAVLEDLSAEEGGALHRAVADVLREDDAPDVETSAHLVAAGSAPETHSVPILENGARQEIARDNTRRAIDCLELALQARLPEAKAASLTAALVRTQWRVRAAAVAHRLDALLAADAGGHLGTRESLLLVRSLAWFGRSADAAAVLARLTDPADPSDAMERWMTIEWLRGWHPEIAARLRAAEPDAAGPPVGPEPGGAHVPAARNGTFREAAGRPAEAAAVGRVAVAGGGHARDRGRAGSAANGGVNGDANGGGVNGGANHGGAVQTAAAGGGRRPARTRAAEGEAVDGAELTLQSCQVNDAAPDVVIYAMHQLLRAGRIDRARFWCRLLLEEADVTWRAVLLDVEAEIAWHRGDLAAVERHARAALDALPAQGWGVAIVSPLSKLILAGTGRGDEAEVRRLLRQEIPDGARRTRFWLQLLHARGTHFLATDRFHAALSDFQAAGWLAAEWGLDRPSIVPWRSDLAQVYLRISRVDGARELVREQLALTGPGEKRIRGISWRVLAHTTTAMKERLALLGKAAEAFQDCGARYELALTYADLGRARSAIGEVGRARMMARHTLQLAEACGADALYERLLPDMAPAEEAGAAGLEKLSGAERRVATHAARGMTNREIARKLYVTESTVEQHLTRVYRKLEINKRSELPARVPMELTDDTA